MAKRPEYKKKPNGKNDTGAPRKEIDWKIFDGLCSIQCTLEEIAAMFDCSVDNIERKVKEQHKMTFAEYYKLKSGNGKVSLRRRQFKAAMDGNTSMLIWLGKQHLGQKDKSEVDSKVNGQQEIIVRREIIHRNATESDTNSSAE